MKLLVFGLSVTSSWGNGHATVYRGLLKQLHSLGADVTFVEKDVPWYAENRDLSTAGFARIRLYGDTGELEDLLEQELKWADVVMMGSYFPDGIVVADRLRRQRELPRLYYDIDSPITLSYFATERAAPYLRVDQIPIFDAILSFTGGRAVLEMEKRWGARYVEAFFCALDPETHRRVEAESRFRCKLGYMGTYSSDRHAAWKSFFLRPAMRLPEKQFVLAGPQYPHMELPPNLRHFQHLAPKDHPAFYSSCDLTLNLTRGPMVTYGYSPSVRLFEAAGCGTCIVSDRWEGLGEIFDMGREILVVDSENEMVGLLKSLNSEELLEIGERARGRALQDHTYAVRAQQFLQLLERLTPC